MFSYRIRAIILIPLLAACERSGGADAGRPDDVDDFGAAVERPERPPQRIVSLSPTNTELLFALGVGHALVGRTSWDLWPDSARLVPDLGPGIRPNTEAVLAARPDLVVLYASEDNRPAAARLRRAGVRVVSLRIDRIDDFRRGTLLLGRAVARDSAAAAVVDTVLRAVARVREATAGLEHPEVYWHIWDEPLITIGAGSFLHELVETAGGRNVYGDHPSPSPHVSLEDVARRNPDIILAGPLGRARILSDARWRSVGAVRRGEIRVVDTALVGRASVQMGEAALSLARVIHPGAIP